MGTAISRPFKVCRFYLKTGEIIGNISDGVECEIKLAKKLGKKIKYFDMVGMPFKAKELKENEVKYEEGFIQKSLE